jgi:serine O-acetyltransferase
MADLPPLSTTLHPTDLAAYVAAQLSAFFPDRKETKAVRAVLRDTLPRIEHCFRHVRIKGFWGDNGPRFDHLHTDQYAIFLYYLANTAHRAGEARLAAKAYALNKALHALDAFYEVELPAIFALVHPVGTVLGRAAYGDYFCAYQNVTVGSGLDDPKPKLGKGIVLYAGARVIGASNIGNNCLISSDCTVLDCRDVIPGNSVIWGRYEPKAEHRGYSFAPTRHDVIRDIFKDKI